jgi:hypothetical protein
LDGRQNKKLRDFKKHLISLAKTWLGREDSNLRMVESKSARILNDFNGFSDETADSAPIANIS